MKSAPSASPALVGLDWGTSSLRAYLMDARGAIIGERAEPWGIMQLGARDFASACSDIMQAWTTDAEVPVIACGMVGSAQGWVEAPYCRSPAGASDIARQLIIVPGTVVHIVPGLAQHGDADVMRGEETQIIGAMALRDDLVREARVVCPGTHSKWVTIASGRIDRFTTYMTGELFATLCAHSILGRFARATATPRAALASDAFRLGVHTVRTSTRDSAALLFSARARVLLGEVAPEASLDYLSGVLIGSEVRDGLAVGAAPAALIGERALCGLYVEALRAFEVRDVHVIDHSAPHGLWQVAVAGGLCAASESSTREHAPAVSAPHQ